MNYHTFSSLYCILPLHILYTYRADIMILFFLLWLQNQNQLPLQINMEGMNDFIEDEIKVIEDSNVQLSSTVCVEQGEIESEEDPKHHPFCVSNVTLEDVNPFLHGSLHDPNQICKVFTNPNPCNILYTIRQL
jgi:hypothetical protein